MINQCHLRRAEQSLHFAPIPTNFSIFITLRPRPRTYASTSPLLLLQLHRQQQVLSIINIINSTNHHLQHAKLRILLQHLTSHAAYERSGGPPKRPAAKRPCTHSMYDQWGGYSRLVACLICTYEYVNVLAEVRIMVED